MSCVLQRDASLWKKYFIDSMDNNHFRVWHVNSKEGCPCGGSIVLTHLTITVSGCGMYITKRGVPVEEVFD